MTRLSGVILIGDYLQNDHRRMMATILDARNPVKPAITMLQIFIKQSLFT
jgi:hypothetical protein